METTQSRGCMKGRKGEKQSSSRVTLYIISLPPPRSRHSLTYGSRQQCKSSASVRDRLRVRMLFPGLPLPRPIQRSRHGGIIYDPKGMRGQPEPLAPRGGWRTHTRCLHSPAKEGGGGGKVASLLCRRATPAFCGYLLLLPLLPSLLHSFLSFTCAQAT